MSEYGFATQDENGNPLVFASARMPRILGRVNTTKYNGSITDPRFAEGEAWFGLGSMDAVSIYLPKIQKSGTGANQVISWTWDQPGINPNAEVDILYGVF